MAQIRADGLFQKDLVTFLTNAQTMANEIKVDFNAVNAKLDADTGVAATNYASTCNIAAAALAIASVGTRGGILNDGIHQGDLATFLSSLTTFANEIKTKLAAVTVKLDADALQGSDYGTTCDLTAASLSVAKLVGTGLSWGPDLWAFVNAALTLLNQAKTNINALEAKLDADTVVVTTTYASGNPVETADLSLTV